MPAAIFSSLPISGGDNNEEDRDEPKIEEDRGEILADDAGGCKDPVDAAAAAAAIFKMVRNRMNFVSHIFNLTIYYWYHATLRNRLPFAAISLS